MLHKLEDEERVKMGLPLRKQYVQRIKYRLTRVNKTNVATVAVGLDVDVEAAQGGGGGGGGGQMTTTAEGAFCEAASADATTKTSATGEDEVDMNDPQDRAKNRYRQEYLQKKVRLMTAKEKRKQQFEAFKTMGKEAATVESTLSSEMNGSDKQNVGAVTADLASNEAFIENAADLVARTAGITNKNAQETIKDASTVIAGAASSLIDGNLVSLDTVSSMMVLGAKAAGAKKKTIKKIRKNMKQLKQAAAVAGFVTTLVSNLN